MALRTGPADAVLTDIRAATALWLIPRANEGSDYATMNSAKLASKTISTASNMSAIADGSGQREFVVHDDGSPSTPPSLTADTDYTTGDSSWALVTTGSSEVLVAWNAGSVQAFSTGQAVNATAVITVGMPTAVTTA